LPLGIRSATLKNNNNISNLASDQQPQKATKTSAIWHPISHPENKNNFSYLAFDQPP
jgi:hypothetical protein